MTLDNADVSRGYTYFEKLDADLNEIRYDDREWDADLMDEDEEYWDGVLDDDWGNQRMEPREMVA